jgi:hypothetical protein
VASSNANPTGARRFRFIFVEESADCVDEKLSFGRNHSSELCHLVLRKCFRPLVGGFQCEPDKLRRVTIGIIFPFGHG